MTQKLGSKKKTTRTTRKPTARKLTTREVIEKMIATNPKWSDTTIAGEAFIIGGVWNPTRPKRERPKKT
jgi:hypothetical protein